MCKYMFMFPLKNLARKGLTWHVDYDPYIISQVTQTKTLPKLQNAIMQQKKKKNIVPLIPSSESIC